jgi:hypothetical protein
MFLTTRMAVQGVSCEPVSPEFPVKQGKNREFLARNRECTIPASWQAKVSCRAHLLGRICGALVDVTMPHHLTLTEHGQHLQMRPKMRQTQLLEKPPAPARVAGPHAARSMRQGDPRDEPFSAAASGTNGPLPHHARFRRLFGRQPLSSGRRGRRQRRCRLRGRYPLFRHRPPFTASSAGAAPSLASPPCSMELRTVIE